MILEKTVTIFCNAIAILCQRILLLKNVNYFSRSFLAIFSQFYIKVSKNGQFWGKIGVKIRRLGTIRETPKLT